jgi:hypothetical protein
MIQAMVYFLPPFRKTVRSPVLSFLGDRWSGVQALELLVEFFNNYQIAEGQSFTFRSHRGDQDLVVTRKNDRLTAAIREPSGAPKVLHLVPHPITEWLSVLEMPWGREYPQWSLSEIRSQVFQVSKDAASLRNISLDEGIQEQLKTSESRGKLLAEAMKSIVSESGVVLNFRIFTEIQQLVEQGCAHLDFSMMETFFRELGKVRSYYSNALEQLNQGVLESQAWLRPEEMQLENLPGRNVVPRSDSLRDTLLRQLFPMVEGKRSPQDNLILLRDPERMAHLFALTLKNEAAGIISEESDLQLLSPGETFGAFLAPERTDLSPRMARLRDRIISMLGDFSDYRRILTGRKGSFHDAFLKELIDGGNNIRQAYKKLFSLSQKIPQRQFLQYQVEALPTWQEIEDQILEDSRRNP